MKYWITTHWPQLAEDAGNIPSGVHLQEGTQQAGLGIGPGDMVFIYESLTGKDELLLYADGRREVYPRIQGRYGVVALCQVTEHLHATDEPQTKYTDGTEKWWRWHAGTKLINSDGFVPAADLARLLGMSPNYNFRGFGSHHSGLKEITEDEFDSIRLAFLSNSRTKAKLPKCPVFFPGNNGGSGESDQHRALKNYVAHFPNKAIAGRNLSLVQMEYPFPTNDRADIVLHDKFGRFAAVEIEVDVGPQDNPGLLQAAKYRALLAVITDRLIEETDSYLIAYSISEKISHLARKYDIECIEINKKEVMEWWSTRSEDSQSTGK